MLLTQDLPLLCVDTRLLPLIYSADYHWLKGSHNSKRTVGHLKTTNLEQFPDDIFFSSRLMFFFIFHVFVFVLILLTGWEQRPFGPSYRFSPRPTTRLLPLTGLFVVLSTGGADGRICQPLDYNKKGTTSIQHLPWTTLPFVHVSLGLCPVMSLVLLLSFETSIFS